MEKRLLPRQKAFADYYLESNNATEAYKKAYPSCKTDGAARTNASKLLTKGNIKTYIAEKNKPKSNERLKAASEVLIYLTDVMRGNTRDSLGLEPSIKDKLKACILLGRRYRLFSCSKSKVKSDALKQLELEHKRLINQRLRVQIKNKL